jgi:hypothetical protein
MDEQLSGENLTMVPVGTDYPEIRDAVRAICAARAATSADTAAGALTR